MSRTFFLLALVALAAAVPRDVESYMEEGDHLSEEVGASSQNQHAAENRQDLAMPSSLVSPAKCLAKVQVLKIQHGVEAKARAVVRKAALSAHQRVRSMDLQTFGPSDLADLGITDLLTTLGVDAPKNSKPSKKHVLHLLRALAHSVKTHQLQSARRLRRLVLGCARTCTLRQRTIKKWARKVFYARSIALRKLLIARKRFVQSVVELRTHRIELKALRVKVAGNTDANSRAVGQKMLNVAASIVKQLFRRAFALRRKVYRRTQIARTINHNARKAQRLRYATDRKCSALGSRVYHPTTTKRVVVMTPARAANIRRRLQRSSALVRFLRFVHGSHGNQLRQAWLAHAQAVRAQHAAMRRERAVRAATPKKEYLIVTKSASSGLRVNFNPKTGRARAIRLNPGQYPPKFKWAFHTTSTSVAPLTPKAKRAVSKIVRHSISAGALAAVKSLSRTVSAAALRIMENSPDPLKVKPETAKSLAAAAAASRARTIAVARHVKQWLDRFPTIVDELRRWFVTRKQALWSWYLKHGHMSKYNKWWQALRAVYAHRLYHLRTISNVLRSLGKRLIMQLRIADVRHKIYTVAQAVRAAALVKARAEKAYAKARSLDTYTPKACPKGFTRNTKNGECVRGPKKPVEKQPNVCGSNLVLIGAKCVCRRGYHVARGKFGKRACISNARRLARSAASSGYRVCQKGFYFYRHRCVKVCPKPYSADLRSRKCLSPKALVRRTLTATKCSGKKHMIYSTNGKKCRCARGFRFVRGNKNACIRYSKNFLPCRRGWFLNGGTTCVRVCPAPLLANKKARTCTTLGGVSAIHRAADRARRLAAKARAIKREQRRSLLRANLRRLLRAHKQAAYTARALHAKLLKARMAARRLAFHNAHDQAAVSARNRELEIERDQVFKLEAEKVREENLLAHVKLAHKRAVARVIALKKQYKSSLHRATLRSQALGNAQLRVSRLAEKYHQSKVHATLESGDVAAARGALQRALMRSAYHRTQRRAAKLRDHAKDVLKAAALRAAALERSQRAAERAASRLAVQRARLSAVALAIARKRRAEIANAETAAHALQVKANGVLTRCIKGSSALRAATVRASEADQRARAALAVAKAHIAARRAALGQAKQAFAARMQALRRARAIYRQKVKVAHACHRVHCECIAESCVQRKAKAAAEVAARTKAELVRRIGAKAANSKGFRGGIRRVKHFVWTTLHRIAALKKKLARLQTVRKAAKTHHVIRKIRKALRKVHHRVAWLRRKARKVLSNAFAHSTTRAWLLRHQATVAKSFRKNDTWFRLVFSGTASPASVVQKSKQILNKFKTLTAQKTALIHQIHQTPAGKAKAEAQAKIAFIRKAQSEILRHLHVAKTE